MLSIVQGGGTDEYNVECFTDLNSRCPIIWKDKVRCYSRLFFSFKDYSGYAVRIEVQCLRKRRLDRVCSPDRLAGPIK